MRRKISGKRAGMALTPTMASSSIGERTDDALGRHGTSTDAGKRQRPAGGSAQGAHERGAKRIAGFLGGDQIDRQRSRWRPVHDARLLRHANEEDPRAIGGRAHLVGLGNDRAAGGDGEPGKAGARDIFDRFRTDRRQVEAAVLTRLGRFDQDADTGRLGEPSFAAQLRNPHQHIVGAFGGFDRHDMAVGDDHRLADIERAERGDEFKAVGDVGAIALRWRTSGRACPAGTMISGATSPTPMMRTPPSSNSAAMPESSRSSPPRNTAAIRGISRSICQSGRIWVSAGRSSVPMNTASRHPSARARRKKRPACPMAIQ